MLRRKSDILLCSPGAPAVLLPSLPAAQSTYCAACRGMAASSARALKLAASCRPGATVVTRVLQSVPVGRRTFICDARRCAARCFVKYLILHYDSILCPAGVDSILLV